MTMTVSIACDDCGESAETSTSYDAGANEIDGVLDEGWSHEGETDLCPSCNDEHISRRLDAMSDYPESPDRPIRCDYCGDALPMVPSRAHIPTPPSLQRLGFDADKVVCPECVEKARANRPDGGDR